MHGPCYFLILSGSTESLFPSIICLRGDSGEREDSGITKRRPAEEVGEPAEGWEGGKGQSVLWFLYSKASRGGLPKPKTAPDPLRKKVGGRPSLSPFQLLLPGPEHSSALISGVFHTGNMWTHSPRSASLWGVGTGVHWGPLPTPLPLSTPTHALLRGLYLLSILSAHPFLSPTP